MKPDHFKVGTFFKTTHPDWILHGIEEVELLGDHGTKSGNYYLLEGTKPDGTKKTYNFSKRLFHSGRIDKHFTPVLSKKIEHAPESGIIQDS